MAMLNYIKKAPTVKKEEATPAIFLLHGIGSNERDLFGFAPYLPPQAYIFSLQAPLSYGFGGYAWYEIYWDNNNIKSSNVEQAHESLKQLQELVTYAQKTYNLDAKKLFLCGFSQGAILSLAYSLNHPNTIAGVAALSGYLNTDLLQHQQINHHATQYYVSHGIGDEVIPVHAARKTRLALEEAGNHLQYQEFDQGHGVNEKNLNDLVHWFNEML